MRMMKNKENQIITVIGVDHATSGEDVVNSS